MSQDVKDPLGKYNDSSLDPAAKEADAIFNRPDMQALNDQGDAIAREDAEKKEADKLGKNPMGYKPDGLPNAQTPRIKGIVNRLRNNRRALVSLGAGGGVLTMLVAGFISFIPLKLELLIKSATQHAAQIPEDAIEQRLRYLTSYYIAHRILSTGSPADSYPEGTVVKQMFKNWQVNRFEDQLGLKITSDRTSNQQTATKWTIEFPDSPVLLTGGNEADIIVMTRKIENSSQMRVFVKTTVKEKTKWHHFYKRYAMRKTLMRTKGVTRWAWLPDAATSKLDSYNAKKNALTTQFKQRLFDATVKRVMPRTALYLACLSDAEACKELHLKRYGTKIEPPDSAPGATGCPAGDTACEQARGKLAEEAANSTDANAESVGSSVDDIGKNVGKESGKFITKQLLSKVAAGLGIVDTLARIARSVDNGALNQVLYDRNSIMAAGYSAELLSISDQYKAGKLTPEQIDTVMEMVGDFGTSPAWQNETGIIASANPGSLISPTANAAAEVKQYERNCGADGEPTKLPPGELICPERKIITDKTAFTSQSWWAPFNKFADIYLGTVGRLFDLFNKVVELTGIDKVMASIVDATGLGDLLAKGMSNMLELIFGSPISALDKGAEVADNMLGGIKSSYYALGEAGQDTDAEGNPNGKGLGLGGQVMTTGETAALKSRIAAEKQEEWNQKSVFAKLFDTEDTRSMTSQLALRMPTTPDQVAALPNMIQSSFVSLFMPKTSAAGTYKDAFGFNFAYSFKEETYAANPNIYTKEACETMAKAREESYQAGKDISADFPIYVYTKSDPCALEKIVVAAGGAMFGGGTDENFVLEGANGGAAPDDENPGSEDPSAAGFVWPIALANWPKRAMPIAECGLRYSDGSIHTGIDISVGMNTPVLAAADGVVTMDSAGMGALNIKTNAKDGANTLYLNYQHLSRKTVGKDDPVTRGQVIGYSGTTGATSPHLHFSIWITNDFLSGHGSPLSDAGKHIISQMRQPLDYMPRDGRNIAECTS